MVSGGLGLACIYFAFSGVLGASFFSASGFSVAADSGELAGSGISLTSGGSGGGVVAMVYPIHATMARITATPPNAVIWRIKVGL